METVGVQQPQRRRSSLFDASAAKRVAQRATRVPREDSVDIMFNNIAFSVIGPFSSNASSAELDFSSSSTSHSSERSFEPNEKFILKD
eukprot:Nk52_evm1s857 gene=Nk52_evmTU1s857